MTLPSSPPLSTDQILADSGASAPITLTALAALYGISPFTNMLQFLGKSIFSASVSPTSSFKSASTATGNAFLISQFTVTAVGQGSITYAWTRVDGYAGFSAGGTSTNQLTLQSTAFFNTNESYTGHWTCHVADSAGNTANLTVSVDHEYSNGN